VSIEQLARDIYAEFKAKPESQHIASEFALVELAKLVAEIKPKSVLEIGAGIGTITKLLLQHPSRPAKLTVTEAHPVCLRELQANLQGVSKDGYDLVQTAAELNIASAFDLVIFDGTLDDDIQYRVFKPGTWCFVEGSRNKTIAALRQKLNATGLTVSMRNVRPGGKKLKLKSVRTFFGLPLPAFKLKPKKGCSIGQITSL
jgi:precorrin-6B methylase 2